MPHTLLLVFIHGFKGSDHTFHQFPTDLRALLSHSLPAIDVVSVQYPRYETRGDLHATVARFKEWLQNKVIDLEVANGTPSPTVSPSVRVVLCGHSMGGIVAAETLLSIAREETVGPLGDGGERGWANDTTNATSTSTHAEAPERKKPTHLAPDEHHREERASSAPPAEPTRLFFPFVQAVIAFDTPYLGISPGVLAHGAEEHLQQASSAYKAFDSASQIFGWSSPRSTTPTPIPDAASRGLPAPSGTGGASGGAWNKWGKYAAFGGAAAALAGAAGAAYLNRNQISQGFAWAGSHLEFVGTLARGADLQKRVEGVVALTRTHGIGFVDFYTALGEKVTSQTKYAGSVLGADRTFCVVPKSPAKEPDSPTGTKRDAPSSSSSAPKRRKSKDDTGQEIHDDAERVEAFVQDTSKSKGRWIKCVNETAADELKAHTTMFTPQKNPNYHVMLPAARDEIVRWVGREWYESSSRSGHDGDEKVHVHVHADAGAQEGSEAHA